MEHEQNYSNFDIQNSLQVYQNVVAGRFSPQCIGLSEKEFETSYSSESTVTTFIDDNEIPLFVQTDTLYWYNNSFLLDEFGGRETYFYTQVPVSHNVKRLSTELLQDNKVIILSAIDGDRTSESLINEMEEELESGSLYIGDVKGAFLNQYLGKIHFNQEHNDGNQSSEVPFHASYLKGVEDGLIEKNEDDGAFIVEKIESNADIDRLWKIYAKPFEEISKTSPISAGYDEVGFKRAMQDPTVIKAINVIDGLITTIAIFETTLNDATWLNKSYFEKKYREEIEAGDFLLFTGIVSDENMRGNAYSADVINLLLQVGKLRGRDHIITFECNEVSAEYLPAIVDSVINDSGFAEVTGLESAISKVIFRSLQLTNAGMFVSE